jgi:hypothetical protein
MNPLVFVGIALNLISALLLIVPLIFVYAKGMLRFKSRERIEDETATKFDGNPSLAEDLLFTRHCALAALPFLIIGTILLVLGQ